MARRSRRLRKLYDPATLAKVRQTAYEQHRRDAGCEEAGRYCGRCRNLLRRWHRDEKRAVELAAASAAAG